MMRGVMGLQISCTCSAFDHASHAPQLRHYNYYYVHITIKVFTLGTKIHDYHIIENLCTLSQ